MLACVCMMRVYVCDVYVCICMVEGLSIGAGERAEKGCVLFC